MRKIIFMMPLSVDGFLVIIGTSAGPVAGADITVRSGTGGAVPGSVRAARA